MYIYIYIAILIYNIHHHHVPRFLQGILVREGQSTTSKQLADRLSTGMGAHRGVDGEGSSEREIR